MLSFMTMGRIEKIADSILHQSDRYHNAWGDEHCERMIFQFTLV